MKICIVSDSHDRADGLAQAVREAKALGAEAVIHCGDLIGAQSLKPALAQGLPVHLIHGNNLGDPQAARKFLGMGKLKSTKYVVKFDILKTEQVAAAQSGFDGRAIGRGPAADELQAALRRLATL